MSWCSGALWGAGTALAVPSWAALVAALGAGGGEARSEAAQTESGSVIALRAPLSQMVRIPAGALQMGSEDPDVLDALADCSREAYGHRCTQALFENEKPRHTVHLSSYWIDRFEVRVAEYERCVQVGRCGPRPSSEATRRFDQPELPVSRVTWNDAKAYCAFRGARLPTEAEFERAARGARGRRYPWGNLFNARAANYGRFGWDETDASDGFAELAPVGSFRAGATPEGVYDLAGNVAEWVADRYSPSYEPGPVTDPTGPGIGGSSSRVVRGGSYGHARFGLRGAARSSAEPSERSTLLGFRCARSDGPRRGG